jgi:hypothetical protein
LGNFKRVIKALVGKGTKAMYDILKSGEFHNLSISCQLELFDKVVKPYIYSLFPSPAIIIKNV